VWAAHEEIKCVIIALELLPGERIHEKAVADRIGIGRTPAG
jgi:DNA-binding GntR family transcriptional regulator